MSEYKIVKADAGKSSALDVALKVVLLIAAIAAIGVIVCCFCKKFRDKICSFCKCCEHADDCCDGDCDCCGFDFGDEDFDVESESKTAPDDSTDEADKADGENE